MSELTRGLVQGLVLVLPIAVGCAGSDPLPAIQPTPADLVRRHYDQVCRVDENQPPALLASELFATEGLVGELETIGPRPLRMAPGSDRMEWGSADYVMRYTRDGRVEATGVWTASVDDVTSSAIARVLDSRVQRLPGLLEAQGFRAVVTLSQPPRLEMAPPIVCSPHVKHPDGGRAYGLPDDVSTRLEGPRFRPRRVGSGPGQATVRIALDAAGQVELVTGLVGDSTDVAAARAIVDGMRFDPALRNGVGVRSEFVQTFLFRGR